MTVLPNITKIPSWLAAIPDPGLAELQACCKAAESVALIYTNALRSNTVSRALCDDVVVMANDILTRVDVARRLPLPPIDVLFRTRAEAARKELPPPDGLRTPARAARKSRKPTLANLLKQAADAGRNVKGAEVYSDRTVLQFGEPTPVEPENSWPLDEFRTKENKQ